MGHDSLELGIMSTTVGRAFYFLSAKNRLKEIIRNSDPSSPMGREAIEGAQKMVEFAAHHLKGDLQFLRKQRFDHDGHRYFLDRAGIVHVITL